MNDFHSERPNQWLYLHLGGMKPFIDNLEIPKNQLKREEKKVSTENYSSHLLEVVLDQTSGEYLVVGGYTTYYAYKNLYKPNTLVLCKAFYPLAEDEQYILTLEWMMKNSVNNWYNRHEIITILIDDFNYTKTELASILGKDNKDIQFYLNPPKKIETEATRQSREQIINKIFLEAFKNNFNKDYLYILILYFSEKITQEQLKYVGWMREKSIKFEERNLTLEQQHQLIEKALHVKVDFLNEIKMMINDMRFTNGDGPINFN